MRNFSLSFKSQCYKKNHKFPWLGSFTTKKTLQFFRIKIGLKEIGKIATRTGNSVNNGKTGNVANVQDGALLLTQSKVHFAERRQGA